LKGRKTRIDSTVVEANIVHPTDAGLLYEGVKKLTKAVARIKQACGKASRQSTTSIRKMKDHLLSIKQSITPQNRGCPYGSSENHRSDGRGSRKVLAQTDRLAKKLIPETENDLKIRGNLLDTAKKVKKIIEQSEAVNRGNTKLADRSSVSKIPMPAHCKRKAWKTCGIRIQASNTGDGKRYRYWLPTVQGKPCDKVLVEDALQKHINLFGKAPAEMSLDRGYYDSANEIIAYKAGVKHVCIPKIGRKSKVRAEFENTPTFRRLKRWRSGIEGRISCLKRRFGLNCSMLDGYRKTQTWTGLVFSPII
jgi:hypothetical protein